MSRLHPDTSEKGKYLIEMNEMVDDVLNMLDRLNLPTADRNTVKIAMFNVMDAWLQNRMRWAGPADGLRGWCEAMRVEYGDIRPSDDHHRVIAFIELAISDKLLDIIPNKTWRMLSFRRVGINLDILLEIGEDFRIVDWMERYGDKFD